MHHSNEGEPSCKISNCVARIHEVVLGLCHASRQVDNLDLVQVALVVARWWADKPMMDTQWVGSQVDRRNVQNDLARVSERLRGAWIAKTAAVHASNDLESLEEGEKVLHLPKTRARCNSNHLARCAPLRGTMQ